MPNLDSNFYLDKQGVRTLINELETNVIAEEFSSSATYALGSYCVYQNNLYRCTTAITTAGSWTGNTNWTQVLVTEDIKSISDEINIHDQNFANQYDSTTTYGLGDWCIYDHSLYRCKVSSAGPEEWDPTHWDAISVNNLIWDNSALPTATWSSSALASMFNRVNLNCAPNYDPTSTYEVGDWCIYSNTLYQCTTAIPTAERWNSSHWTAQQLTNQDINSLRDVQIDSSTLTTGQVLVYNNGHWENGEGGGGASSLDDLTDVTLTNLAANETLVCEMVNNDPVFKNKATTWTGTQAEYNALAVKDPNVTYYITDGDGAARYIICTQSQYNVWKSAGTLEADTPYYVTDANNSSIVIDDNNISSDTVWSSNKTDSEIQTKVSKSGDTMTGRLTTPSVVIPKGDANGIYIRTKVNPAGTTYDTAAPINITDNNGDIIFQIHPYHNGNGNGDMLTEFYCFCRKPNGIYTNSFSIGFDDLGNPKVEFSSPSAWRTALDAVSKSGDTMTGELVTSAGKVAMGSGMSNASTIEALVEDLRFTNGCAGSVYITTPYTLNGIEIPAEWYHYFYAPHRSGGYNGGIHPDYEDNTLYGCIILSDLFGNSERSYIIHFIREGSTAYPTIKTVKKLMCDEPTTKLTQHGEGRNKTFTKLYEQLNENGSIRSYVEQTSNPDDFSRCVIGVRGYWANDTLASNVYIGVMCNHTTNHTPGYILSHPKAFLDSSTSVGKLTSLTYATKNSTYVDSAATSYVRYVRSGHIVNVFYAFTTKGALTNRWVTLFSGLPKPVDSLYLNGEGDRLAVSTTGVIQNVYTTSAATFSRGTFTYITDDFT